MKIVNRVAFIALSLLSLSGLWGGATLIGEAHENPWGFLPQSLLCHSPFHSYLVPGIVLFSANGLLPLWVLWLLYTQKRSKGIWTAFQGCVLFGWLIVECLMLRVLIWPHYLYGAIALLILGCGALLSSESKQVISDGQ